MPHFKAKMHPVRFRLRLSTTDPAGDGYSAPQTWPTPEGKGRKDEEGRREFAAVCPPIVERNPSDAYV